MSYLEILFLSRIYLHQFKKIKEAGLRKFGAGPPAVSEFKRTG